MVVVNHIKQLKNSKAQFDWDAVSKPKVKIIHKYAGHSILDVGCSSGSYVKKLSDDGYLTYGCDILTDKNWRKIGLNKFKTADVYNLPYKNNEFETVIFFETLEHIDKPLKAIQELSRVAKKNFIISIPQCYTPPIFELSGLTYWHNMDRTHVNFFTQKSIQDLLHKNGFTIDYFEFINPVMSESLFLNAWHMPLNISVIIGKILQRLPFSKKYYTDMVLVVSKKQKNKK